MSPLQHLGKILSLTRYFSDGYPSVLGTVAQCAISDEASQLVSEINIYRTADLHEAAWRGRTDPDHHASGRHAKG